MKNYQKVNVPAGEARVELHDSLNLTGAEVSISNLPAGAGVPFVHSHKQNEEIYAVLSGRGTMVVDGEIVELQAGDWLRVAPAGERQLSAAADVYKRQVGCGRQRHQCDLYSGESRLFGRLYDDGRCGEVRGSHTSRIKVIGNGLWCRLFPIVI